MSNLYKVIGSHIVGGVAPGGTVSLGDDVNVDALIAAGHVEPVKPAKPAPVAVKDGE